jgi:hypothetical protein
MLRNIGSRRSQFTQLFRAFSQEFYGISHNKSVNR